MHKHELFDTAPTAGNAPGGTGHGHGHAMAGALSHEWLHTPLGPPEKWPAPLKALSQVVHYSTQPMFIAWGPSYRILHNEAFSALFGIIDGQGYPLREGLPELESMESTLSAVFDGKPVTNEEYSVVVNRESGRTVINCTLSCTPVSEDNEIIGAFCICNEQPLPKISDERAAFHHAIAEATPECIKIVGADGCLVHMNAAGLEMIEATDGHSPLGGRVLDLIGPEYRAEWEENHRRVCSGERLTWEFDLIGLKGTRRRMETHAVPLPMPDGTTGQLAVTRDITARRKAEAAFVESEARFRELADNIPTLCWVAHPDGHIYWYNRRWYDYTGTDPAHQEGWGWESVHDPETLPQVVARWKQSLATGIPFEMVFPLRGADGVYRPFLTRVEPIRDEAGAIVRWFGTNTDITQQRAAEAALRESEERFRNMADHAPVMIWMTDERNARTYLNRRWFEYTGQDEDMVLDSCWLDAAHPEDRPHAERAFHKALSKKEPFRIEYRLRRADGHYRWMIAAAAPRFGQSGKFHGFVGSIIDIDERRETEMQLAFSEERLRLATDLADVGFWDVDVIKDEMFWPPRVKAMFGISSDVPVSMTDFFNGIHPDDRERTIRAYVDACDPVLRALYDVEYRTIGKEDGIMRWIAAKGRGVFDDTGRCTRVLGTAIDITQRRHKEQELRDLNQDLEQVIAERTRERDRIWNVSQDLLVVSDPKGIWLNCNPAWERALGWKVEDFIGRTSAWVEHPDDKKRTDDKRAHLEGGGIVMRFENRFRHKDGSYRWLSWTAVPDDGRVYAVARDVTAEKEQESRLAASETRFRAIFNSAFQFMALLDADGTVIEVNDTAMNWSAIEPTDIVGKPFWLAPPMRDNTQLQMTVKDEIRRAASGTIVRAEHEMRGAGELKAIVDFSIKSVPGPDGKAAYLVAEGRDVTEVRRVQEQMRQAQKMEAVGQLTGGIAHDFNNLLQALQGCVEMIRRKPGDEAWVIRLADAAMASAQRGVRLTSQLLAFSRSQELQLRPVLVDPLIEGMTELLTRTLGHTIDFKLDLRAAQTAVIADPTQLEMAILNLCINARDAMQDGGCLKIATIQGTYNRPGDDNKFVEIRVSDTGVGMPPEIIARAFDPFFTTKKIGEGTGLGLSQVYGFVQQAGGQVHIESEPGHGTSVIIQLKVTELPSPQNTDSTTSASAKAANPAHILVVDDDPEVRTFLSDCLESLGYNVRTATNAEEGLTAIASSVPDLLLADFAMPGMSGAALAAKVRAQHPDLPIVFASGYSDTAEIEAAVGDSIVMLRKPFKVDELAKVIESSLF